MELTEAQELTKLSSIEHSSIQRYLGFQHTGINILANLTPFTYQIKKLSTKVHFCSLYFSISSGPQLFEPTPETL